MGLRLLDQANERRVGALRRRAIGAHIERGAGVRRSTQHRQAGSDRDRQRFAAQRARVDDRLRTDHGSVHRHYLACTDNHDVARPHLVDRHRLYPISHPQLGDLGGPLDQRRQLTPGPCRGDVLQRLAAREHEADDDASKLLAQRERPDHGHQRDRVDPHVMIDDHRSDHLERELGSQQHHRREPHVTRRSALAREVQHAADQNRQRSHRCEDPRTVRNQPAPNATAPSRTLPPAGHAFYHRRHPFRGHTPLSANMCPRASVPPPTVAVEPRSHARAARILAVLLLRAKKSRRRALPPARLRRPPTERRTVVLLTAWTYSPPLDFWHAHSTAASHAQPSGLGRRTGAGSSIMTAQAREPHIAG